MHTYYLATTEVRKYYPLNIRHYKQKILPPRSSIKNTLLSSAHVVLTTRITTVLTNELNTKNV